MTSSQTSSTCPTLEAKSYRRPISRLVGAAVLVISMFVLSMSTPYFPAVADETSLEDGLSVTPLVLKDGRIARVSIHNIPFPDDAAALASATASELETFTQSMATDCFLTAQVIGHVDKKETGGRDTADIHRLARARADTIQDLLIDNGLPAASIASVWDWQFMVKDARATLWVFRLAAGDDCEEEALRPVASEQVATLDDKTATKPKVQSETARSSEQPSKQVKQRVVAAAKTAAPEVTKQMPASLPNSKKKSSVKQTVKPAVAPASETQAPAQQATAATQSQEVDKKGRVSLSESGALEITFATNSSYLPQGASKQLRAFLDRLDQGKSYVVRVQTSIDGDPSVAGTSSKAEAAKYNKWLAGRRFERVKDWLMKNSDGSTLKIEPTEVTNDGPRKVIVELNPLG